MHLDLSSIILFMGLSPCTARDVFPCSGMILKDRGRKVNGFFALSSFHHCRKSRVAVTLWRTVDLHSDKLKLRRGFKKFINHRFILFAEKTARRIDEKPLFLYGAGSMRQN
jgi:hypothetical protein